MAEEQATDSEHTTDTTGQVEAAQQPDDSTAQRSAVETPAAQTPSAQQETVQQAVQSDAPLDTVTNGEIPQAPQSYQAAKPHIPSPSALAKKPVQHVAPLPSSVYSDAEVKAAETFGRVDEEGNVFVTEAEGERVVGQFPNASPHEALSLYAHRFLDLKAKLDVFATRLSNAKIKSHEIDESLKALEQETAQPAAVGDIAALKAQLEELRARGEKQKAQIEAERKAATDKAVAERTKIAEKAEALAASLGDSTNWRSTGDQFRALFDEWQAHQRNSIRLNKTQADALWHRFASARSAFNQARRQWEQTRDAERDSAKTAKKTIIAEAEQLQNSTAWGETSRAFNTLMDRWKKAGHAGRRDDDALWTRFRAAADTFFNARQADREKINSSEKENLVKKEALLTKAEALLPVADEAAAKKARQSLSAIQDEWDQIGYIPREDIHRVEGRLDAVDKQIKAVEDAAWKKSDPEADARKSSFEDQLTAQLDELTRQIEAESNPKKKKALEAEKATKEQWLNVIS